jgi:hypothetical protein
MIYWDLKIRRVIGLGLIKAAFVVIFGILPRSIKIKISCGADDTGELVIRHRENVGFEPIGEK